MAGFLKAGTDLDSLLAPLRTMTKRANVGFTIAGTDISNNYASASDGTPYGTTNFTAAGTDIGTLFAAKGSVTYSGQLWAWGQNNYGVLGLGDKVHRVGSTPTQVGLLTNWYPPVCSADSVMCTKSDGTLWGWGRDDSINGGWLAGLGNRSSPTQVGTLTNWKQVSTGGAITLAVKTDGTLWAWGRGTYGGLGTSDRTDRNSPVQVGSLTNWNNVSTSGSGDGANIYQDYTFAIKTDKTLWSWGHAWYGVLGTGDGDYESYDEPHRSSPVQVGALTNWKSINAGGAGVFSASGLTDDGKLWSWGQYMLPGYSWIDKPSQYGSDTNWEQDGRAGATYTLTKNNGTLWQADYITSAIQVGALTTWTGVSAGNSWRHSIKS